MWNEIKKLSWDQSMLTMTGFLGSVSPGFLILYLYKPELISSLETLKLIIFSLVISMPVVFLNVVLCRTALSKTHSDIKVASIALYSASIVFYPSIFISYFCQFSFEYFLRVVFVMQFIVTILNYLTDKIGVSTVDRNLKNESGE